MTRGRGLSSPRCPDDAPVTSSRSAARFDPPSHSSDLIVTCRAGLRSLSQAGSRGPHPVIVVEARRIHPVPRPGGGVRSGSRRALMLRSLVTESGIEAALQRPPPTLSKWDRCAPCGHRRTPPVRRHLPRPRLRRRRPRSGRSERTHRARLCTQTTGTGNGTRAIGSAQS